MSVQVERLERNMAKLTIEISAEDFEKAIEKTYQKSKSRFNVPGFRKGKVPRKMIEKMYGVGVFYEDAVNDLLPASYDTAADESELEIVSRPQIDITQIESGKPVVYTATVAVKPEVELGEYKGLTATAPDLAVTDEEVKEVLRQEQEKNAVQVVVNRAVQSGDTAVIDYEGFVDGVAFQGGKGENHALVIGSNQFIPGFEDQLIGKETGQEVDVNVTFPTPYQSKDLEGKDAVFKVTIKEVKGKDLPEIDDEFASEVSEFDTLKEYEDDIRKTLVEKKAEQAKAAKEDELINLAVEAAKMEIPDAMVETEARGMVDDFAGRMRQQGLTMEQYFKFTGMNQAKLLDQMKDQAFKKTETVLVLEAIAAKEGLKASEEELNEYIENMAKSYSMEVEQVKNLLDDGSMKQIKKELATKKAVDFLVENSVEKEAEETEKEPEAKEADKEETTIEDAVKEEVAKEEVAE